jgi:dihydroorotate dehydrogenase
VGGRPGRDAQSQIINQIVAKDSRSPVVLGLDALHKSLLRLDPESAHDRAIDAMRLAQALGVPLGWLRRKCVVTDPRLEQTLWDQPFPNPVGLAAGYDKNAQVVHAMAALGFGFLEVGTVTPMPQRGNPKPRVFRHPEQRSLQNALGFNNSGGAAMADRLRQQAPSPLPIGINIGKNKNTTEAEAFRDYETLVDTLAEFASYLVINVSSPNTPGLRDLQRQETVVDLVKRCRERTVKPVLVKLAPDLEDREAVELSVTAVEAGAAGVVVTNTTIDYSLLPGIEARGGLSGRVLRRRSFEVLQLVARHLENRGHLISVGGVESAIDVYSRLKAGASLVQLYTAMIYEGPLLVNRMLHGLLDLMENDGVTTVNEVIGVDLH